MTTDTSEKGLETLIMRHMTGTDGLTLQPNVADDRGPPFGGTGYLAGSTQEFDRAHALDAPQLFAFLQAAQPLSLKKLEISNTSDAKDLNRLKFLTRLSNEIGNAA